MRLCLIRRLGGFQVAEVHVLEFLRAVAAHPAVRLVDLEQVPLGVDEHVPVHGRVQDGAVPLRVLPQRLFSALALSDIDAQADQTERPARVVVHAVSERVDPADLAVRRTDDAVFRL